MIAFLSAPKNNLPNDRNPVTTPLQTKPAQSNMLKDTFNVSHYLKAQQSKKNKWIGNLHQKPLLQVLADSVQIKEFTPINSSELNCYERLKKLLSMQSGIKLEQKQTEQNAKMLNNVVILQNQISKLQAKFRQNEIRKNKRNKTIIKSVMGSKNNSFFQRTSPESSSLNTTQKSLVFRENYKLRKRIQEPKNQNEEIKQTVKEDVNELKEVCMQKFVAHKKKLNDGIFEEVQQFINTNLQKKIDDVISCKLKQTYLAQEQNKKWKMVLLEKELEIESLKKQLKCKQEKIINHIKIAQPQQEMANYRKNILQFYQEYEASFGSMRLNELKKKLDFLQNMYINKYAHQEAKYLQRLNKTEEEKREISKKMNEKLLEYENREVELRQLINRRRKYEQLDNSDQTHQIYNKINQYKVKADELQELQKFIFNKYTQWVSSKSEVQNKLIQLLNNNSVEDYKQMIETMLDFEKGFGNQHKHIQFISKLCNVISKIKKTTSPSSVYKKLEPIKTLQQIQQYLINLKRRQKKTKTVNRGKQYLNDQQS